ncbi:MAG: HEAT repeat domain-containing protein [Spirochaetaceae bacterium]
MEYLRVVLFACLLGLLLPSPMEGQEAPDWVRLYPENDLTTEEQADRQIMVTMAGSGRREDQLYALQEIERLVGSGAWDASTPYAQEVIGMLVLGAYRRSVRPEGSAPDPSIRARGVRLLGALGGRRSELLIRDILRYEEDSHVRAEAVSVLSRLRVGLDQELADLLILSIRREIAGEPDYRFVSSLYDTIYVADTIGEGVEDPDLFYALFDLVEEVDSRSLREEGYRLLKHLAEP